MATSKRELAFNATRWMERFKVEKENGNCPKSVNAIFIMFDASSPTDSAVCVGSMNHAAIVDACKGILKKLGQDPDSRIIKPGEFVS